MRFVVLAFGDSVGWGGRGLEFGWVGLGWGEGRGWGGGRTFLFGGRWFFRFWWTWFLGCWGCCDSVGVVVVVVVVWEWEWEWVEG